MAARNRVTDEELLALIKLNVIRFESGMIVKYHSRKRRALKLTPFKNRKDGRFKFNLGFGHNGHRRQRKIQAARLIWMVVHKQVVPEGKDVDHKDQNKTNDHPENLRLRDIGENRSDNHHKVEEFFNRIIAAQNGSLGDY